MIKTITIIGAGLAGCFLAVLLANRGYKVRIYERASKDEIFNHASKRSFNLTFYGYGVQALKDAGLWNVIKQNVLTLKGSITQVGENGKPIVANLDQTKMPYYTVSRARLLQILLQQCLQNPAIGIHFDRNLININRENKTITVEDTGTEKHMTIDCEVILGTDGVNSKVREFLQQGQDAINNRDYAEWTYKQVSLSKTDAENLNLQHSFMHAWTRKEAIFTAFPNADGSFAAMLILPKDETKGFASLSSDEKVKDLFNTHFRELRAVVPTIITELKIHPESHFVTMSTSPWYYKGFLAILGDAAHAFLPFYGQGISTAFADCMELVKLIDIYDTDFEKIFPLYQAKRKQQTDVLGSLSKQSFSRYTRTKKADFSAIYDGVEAMLYKIFPHILVPPLFVSVANDPIHSAEHFKRHQRQRKIGKLVGVSLAVSMLTGIIALQEKLQKKRPH